MCNINTLFVKNKTSRITPFLMAVSSHSFVYNHNGEGIYFNSSDRIIKNENKIDYFEYEKEIEASDVVISHQRISTSGFELRYNHPYDNENFVLVHNGVINQFKNHTGSDTFGFWNKFNEEFNKIKSHMTRQEKVIKVIKDLFKVDSGSYSILIYDKKTKNSFYFRNSPQINFYQNKNYLFVTTNDDNEVFLSMLDKEDTFKALKIEPRKIYKIDKEFKVFEVCKIKDERVERPQSSFNTLEHSDYYEVKEEKQDVDEAKEEFQTNLSTKTDKAKFPKLHELMCNDCGKMIKGKPMHDDLENPLCYNCWKDQNNWGQFK